MVQTSPFISLHARKSMYLGSLLLPTDMREETQIPPGEAQTQTSRTHRQKKKHTHTRKQDITLLTDTVPGVYCIPGSRVKESAVEKGEKIKVIKHVTC